MQDEFVDRRVKYVHGKRILKRKEDDEFDKKIRELRRMREKIAAEKRRIEVDLRLKVSEEQAEIWNRKIEEINKKIEELKKMKKEGLSYKQVKFEEMEKFK
jgi:hypothetical protein